MPIYVLLARYTEEGRTNIERARLRRQQVTEAADRTRVTLQTAYLTRGEHEVVCLVEAPDDAAIQNVVNVLTDDGAVEVQALRPLTPRPVLDWP